MTVSVEVEDQAWNNVPVLEELARVAVAAALAGARADSEERETFVLFTDDVTIAGINAEWRGKNVPTNVLSFPASESMPVPEGEMKPLGDIVLAHGVSAREADEQGKTLQDHATHLIVHAVLHLLGYDHEGDAEADDMERLEIEILKGLGISNPYERQ
jgi:probable rRNA maturation factor